MFYGSNCSCMVCDQTWRWNAVVFISIQLGRWVCPVWSWYCMKCVCSTGEHQACWWYQASSWMSGATPLFLKGKVLIASDRKVGRDMKGRSQQRKTQIANWHVKRHTSLSMRKVLSKTMLSCTHTHQSGRIHKIWWWKVWQRWREREGFPWQSSG